MLTPDVFRRAEELFHRLVDAGEEERRRALGELEDREPEVHAEVSRLLDGATRRRAGPDGIEGLGVASERRRSGGLGVPERIGRYRLVRLLGEGGMGRVFEAEQERPVRRRVALKLLRDGAFSGALLDRFQAERQALAVMDHPGIARVLDADATEDGRPWFVMELVPGEPITDFCRKRALSIEERLRLFLDVLEAVQHAHQKGIIHRDLKPSNLLVVDPEVEADAADGAAPAGASDPGRPPSTGGSRSAGHPKVIDFGIAKPVGEPWGIPAGATRAGDLIGTPEYMSPEQASLDGRDVDIRSDVYSLGLVLYEMLSGELPVPGEELRSAGFDEMRRTIREREARRPSERLQERLRASATGGPPADSVRPRDLRGDLDWIVLRALEKDRDRRYPTVAAFADDLRRHLDDEPVAAGPPTFTYRARKFVRRHRLGFAAASVALVGLLGGLAGTTWGLLETRRSEAEARRSAAEAERASRTAERANEFLVSVFRSADPREAAGEEVTLQDVLAQAVERIDELEDEPASQLYLLSTLGDVHRAQARHGEAEPLLRRVIDFRPPDGTVDPEDLERQKVTALARLAGIERDRSDLDEAEGLLREAIRRAERSLPPNDESLGFAMNSLGMVLRRRGEVAEAREIYERSLGIAEANEDPPGINVASVVNNLAQLSIVTGDYGTAVRETRRAFELFDPILPPGHPARGVLLTNLAVALRNSGDLPGALRAVRGAERIDRKALGPDHPSLADDLLNLGWILQNLGELDEAGEVLRESVRIYASQLGPDNPRLSSPLARLGRNALFRGDLDEAERSLFRALTVLDGPEGPWAEGLTAHARDLALVLRLAGRPEEAATWNARALERARTAGDEEAEALALLQRAIQLLGQGDPAGADEVWDRALRLAGCRPGTACALDSPESLIVRGTYLARRGRAEEALSALELLFDRRERLLWILESPDLDGLEGRPGFESLRSRWRRAVGEPDAADGP